MAEGGGLKDLFRKKKKSVTKTKPQAVTKSTPEPAAVDDDWGVPEEQEQTVFVGGKGVGQLSTMKRETEADLAVKVVAEDTRQLLHQVRAKAALGPTSPPATPTPAPEPVDGPRPLAGSRPGVWRSARAQAAEAGAAVPFKNKVEDFPALAPTPGAPAPASSKGSAWGTPAVPTGGEGEEPQGAQALAQPEEAPAAPAEPPKEAKPVVAEEAVNGKATGAEATPEAPPPKAASPVPQPPPPKAPSPPPEAAPAPVQPPAAPEPEKPAEAATADLTAKFGKKKKKKGLDD